MFHRFHRQKPPSTPTSPTPDQTPSWDNAPPINDNPHAVQDVYPRPDIRPRSSSNANTNNAAPFLPPITRVTSNEPARSFGLPELDPRPDPERKHQPVQQARSPQPNSDSGFIGGVALQNYRRNLQDAAKFESSGRPPSSGGGSSVQQQTGLPESHITRSKPPPPPIKTNFAPPRPAPPQAMHSMPQMHLRQPPSDIPPPIPMPTGKRPAGTRLVSEPPILAQTSMAADTHKARKGLPFLKNPMSNLLGRKRAVNQAPDDLTLARMPNQPTYQPIRGTRVHDFSAPRQQRRVYSESPNPEQDTFRRDVANPPHPSMQTRMPTDLNTQAGQTEIAPNATHSSDELYNNEQEERERAFRKLQDRDRTPLEPLPETRRLSTDKPLPEEPLPPIPHKNSRRVPKAPVEMTAGMSPRPSTRSSRTISMDGSATVRPMRSTATNKSRYSHISQRDGVASSVPSRMKSASSRFSFMIGSASQEKIMEERHRQKELERQTNNPELASGPRDSRFDDFDDDIDYDAMMDDDGFEEEIPTNDMDYNEDDYDGYEEEIPTKGMDYNEEEYDGSEVEDAIPEEAEFDQYAPDDEQGRLDPIDDICEEDEGEMDPDNDQENFAGFVFERSNPVSTLTSPLTPGMMATPRDDVGNTIGFAMTKDGTPDLHQLSLESPAGHQDHTTAFHEGTAAGLGIQGHSIAAEPHKEAQSHHEAQFSPSPLNNKIRNNASYQVERHEDEMYFDQGLQDELDFGPPQSDVPFDESIFDDNDTDQWGRPIKGAFAQAQAMRRSVMHESAPKGSDVTSRQSGQSQLSESTAHTSMSVGAAPQSSTADKPQEAASISPTQPAPFAPPADHITDEERVVAYQAALAAAAHHAAASGKFRRDSSPPPLPTDLILTSPTASAPNSGRSHAEGHFADLDNYEDDPYAQDMNDYDYDDDDDFVAAANAEALANDSDDFYGQEFGFYSAPIPAPGHSSHQKAPSASASGSAPLNAENLYQYASGGYFGPSGGLGRNASTHVVSREPNLTPITERSEYSNRNSIMSLGLPPALGSGGDLRSPGLAQLAMMADDDNMTLSDLMRLRKKAFGGSQVSLSPSSREGSPQLPTNDREGAISPWGTQTSFLGMRDSVTRDRDPYHGRKNSSFSVNSVVSRDSDAGSGAGSPTLTMNMNLAVPAGSSVKPPPSSVAMSPQTSSASYGGCPPVLEDEETPADDTGITTTSSMSESAVWMKSHADHSQTGGVSPNTPVSGPPQTRRPAVGHRHKGSADSISYTKEEDGGEARWVMERRRTAETGEVEVLGREFVTDGRI